jgi:hypothetical protein
MGRGLVIVGKLGSCLDPNDSTLANAAKALNNIKIPFFKLFTISPLF